MSGGGSGTVVTADRLVGSWEGNFQLADEFRSQSTVTRGVHGTLVFVQARRGLTGFPDMAAPLHYGLYDIDFSPYGFDSRVTGVVPTAIARTLPTPASEADSVFIVLDPERRGVIVLMRGQLLGDRADGVWTAVSSTRSGIGESGSFVMTRARSAHK
ncbi:MAG: hypothetical protein M3P12_01245 [Gemmatimonadota bacterium]|nr:hypothetical protein [Gemmatimonadota bacterium]